MKIITIGPLTLIWATGKDGEKAAGLAAGTHHVHRNQPGGPRKVKLPGIAEAVALQRVADMENTGDSNTFDADKVMEAMAGMEDKNVTLGTGPAFKRDCQRWKECMDENPMQRLAGCGSGEDICDGYLPPEEAPHVSD